MNSACEPDFGMKSDLEWRMRAMEVERERERKRGRFHPATGKLLPRESRNRSIHDRAFVREPLGLRKDAELWITYNPWREDRLRMLEEHPELVWTIGFCDPDALNGYVAWPKRHGPRLPMKTGGLVQYIPVHGGVTYAVKDSFATVWGFDTMHAGSQDVERTNPDWIRYECALLHHGLQVAEGLWPKFRRERDVQKRAEMAQALLDIEPAASGGLGDRLGFTALFNLLGGKIG
jgi:hypothetical protein